MTANKNFNNNIVIMLIGLLILLLSKNTLVISLIGAILIAYGIIQIISHMKKR